ncbi:TIGR03943 family protein [Bacillus shivajii]|uniref:TIGR03943 family putative permease subunit n=1 Tax=Bacillus shivajii TaxID=1983719 RepID=UPI001CF9EC4F|nr:TIGR03943 family protein [Bacillus shivajii]UCZ53116.1 TIGR03943 family protein [Bacillus shivajii]
MNKKAKQKTQKKQWDFHVFLRGTIFLGFSLLMISMIVNNSIHLYIAPRMMIFVYFALAMFLFLSGIQYWRSTPRGQAADDGCHCEHNHQMKGSLLKKTLVYSIFLTPLLLGFVLPEAGLNSSFAENRGVNIGGVSTYQLANEYEEDANVRRSSMEDLYIERFAQSLAMDERIVIDDESYIDILNALQAYPDELIGQEVEITGFMFHDAHFEDEGLGFLSRFAMICCTADSSLYGLPVKGGDILSYENDDWLRVTGEIVMNNVNGWDIPVVVVTDITEVSAPSNPYVYPSF